MSEFSFPLKYEYSIYTFAGDYIIKNLSIPSAQYLCSGATTQVICPLFNTSNITNMRSMFYESDLVSVPLFDTSNVTNMSSMFYYTKVKSVPLFDTSNVTNMSSMFMNCSNLKSVPLFDTSNVTNMAYMLKSCSNIFSIPQFDTSNVTNMQSAFDSCSCVSSIPLLDCSSINSGTNMNIFGSINPTSNIIHLSGFKDLGKVSSFSKPSYFLKYCPNLTKESVLNVLNNLYDRASAGYSVITLPFHTNALALLSDEEKAIATNKGWTLATS